MKLLVSFIAHCFKNSPYIFNSEEFQLLHALHENPIYVFPEQELRGLSPNFQLCSMGLWQGVPTPCLGFW